MREEFTYSEAIQQGFDYLLKNHNDVFVIGQGLWSPWYVGNTMKNLEKKYGTDRIIDTPVSESACTAAALGASISGMRPIVVHPRMDFMLYAMDAIVNEAAKWSYIFGGESNPKLTIRSIINRGGEQGAQHSQALHSWFAHIPGLRVIMPYTVKDARDLLIASVLSNDPVLFIDDRWLYEQKDYLDPIRNESISNIKPKTIQNGNDITLIGAGYSVFLAEEARKILIKENISCEVIDLRVLNPFDTKLICESVSKTGSCLAIDGGWKTCGIASEILASIIEKVPLNKLKSNPRRITLANSPAPTASSLEDEYYPSVKKIVESIKHLIN